jgi:hypothetical protein
VFIMFNAPTPVKFDLSTFSLDELIALSNDKKMGAHKLMFEEEISRRKQKRAYVTVQILKNTKLKQIDKTDNVRINCSMVSATLENAGPEDELTLNFGQDPRTARVQTWIQIPLDVVQEHESFSTGFNSHVTFEVSLSPNPEKQGAEYVLCAQKIQKLESVYNPELKKNVTTPVWIFEGKEEALDAITAQELGCVPAMTKCYSELIATKIVAVKAVNLAASQAEKPVDISAWIEEANAEAAAAQQKNLAASAARKQAEQIAAQAAATAEAAAMAEGLKDSNLATETLGFKL